MIYVPLPRLLKTEQAIVGRWKYLEIIDFVKFRVQSDPISSYEDAVEVSAYYRGLYYKWTYVDGISDCVGYNNVLDVDENPYILDLMKQTIAAYDAYTESKGK